MPAAPPPDRCPGCGAPAVPAHAPFCSQGCRDRDLLLWLTEAHRLPGPPGMEDEEESEQAILDRRPPPPL